MEQLTTFRPWVKKVMPTIYDDTLTYYELLTKVIGYLNQVIDQAEETIDYIDTTKKDQTSEMVKLRNQFNEVQNWLRNEALPTAIAEKITNMFESGELANIINNEVFNMKANTTDLNNTNIKVNTNEQTLIDTNKKVSAISKTLTSFGAVGDGVANDSLAFKNFLLSGGNLTIPKGMYMIDGGVYSTISDTNLTFEDGAKLRLLPHALTNYSIIQVKDVENVTIKNAWIDGSKAHNSVIGGEGEWGHGIDVLNSTNVLIEKPTIFNTWGDGIYIGHDYYGLSTKLSGDITVVDPFIDGSRRNGISVCSGRNIKIIRPHIKNIRGVNPMAGIDIEPEGKGGAKPFLENLLIVEPVIENCVSGVELMLEEMKDRNLSTSIKVVNPTIKKCQVPLTIGKCSGVVGGTVVYSDVQVEKAELGVMRMIHYKAENTPRILIDGLVVDGFNTTKSTNDFYNHLLIFLGLPDDPTLYDIGNITINNLIVNDNTNNVFRFLFADLQGTAFKVRKSFIINPYLNTTKERTNFVRKTNEIKIIDGLETLRNFGTYFEQSIDNTLMTNFDSVGSLDTITLNSNDVNVPIGHRLRLHVGSTSRVWFKPTTYVNGYTNTNGKGIYSETIGNTIDLLFKGNYWIVVGVSGTWTSDI